MSFPLPKPTKPSMSGSIFIVVTSRHTVGGCHQLTRQEVGFERQQPVLFVRDLDGCVDVHRNLKPGRTPAEREVFADRLPLVLRLLKPRVRVVEAGPTVALGQLGSAYALEDGLVYQQTSGTR